MATRSGNILTGTTESAARSRPAHFRPHLGGKVLGTTEALSTGRPERQRTHKGIALDLSTQRAKYYLMSWRDVDCAGTVYRTWTAAAAPDYSGALYSGPKCGSTPISNALIAFEWTVG